MAAEQTICGNWRGTPRPFMCTTETAIRSCSAKSSRTRYGDFHRGLCLLDPYALNLDWEVVQGAGQMHSIEIFLNFMVMDVNMNVLWKNPDAMCRLPQLARMDAFWGDRS